MPGIGISAADHQKARGKVWDWTCPVCGLPFKGYSHQRYCGPSCASRADRKPVECPTSCARCGAALAPPPAGKRGRKCRYCGEACRRAAHYHYQRKTLPKPGG